MEACAAPTSISGSVRDHFRLASGSLLVRQLVGRCSLLSQFGSRRASRRRKGDEYRKGWWPRSVVTPLHPRVFVMTSSAREFFTVDLRGLRAALSARAARDGLTESDVLRSALAVALRDLDVASPTPAVGLRERSPATRHVKLSVRVSTLVAHRLHLNGRAAGLSRGAYLMRLIDGAPPVIPSAERVAGFAALNASASELALLQCSLARIDPTADVAGSDLVATKQSSAKSRDSSCAL